MFRDKKYFIFIIPFALSCAYFKKSNPQISPNHWTGDNFIFVDLGDDYKKTNSFNKQWSLINKKRFRPYHKFLDKSYKISGTFKVLDNRYIVIENENGIMYKMKIDYELSKKNDLPGYLLFDDIQRKAKELLGKSIWLNNTVDSKGFFSYSDYKFNRFEKVIVIDIFPFQNKDNDFPVWLKVLSSNGREAFVRYNGEEDKIGLQDHYYTKEPLPKSWGDKTIKKIIEKRIELGMTDKQIKIAIGNPDEINITSSRHGVSEQWIYRDFNGKDKYFQFEYGILVHSNH